MWHLCTYPSPKVSMSAGFLSFHPWKYQQPMHYLSLLFLAFHRLLFCQFCVSTFSDYIDSNCTLSTPVWKNLNVIYDIIRVIFSFFFGGNDIDGCTCLLYLTPFLTHWLYGNAAGSNFWGWRASWFIFWCMIYSKCCCFCQHVAYSVWSAVRLFPLFGCCLHFWLWLSMSSDLNLTRTQNDITKTVNDKMRACFTILPNYFLWRVTRRA